MTFKVTSTHSVRKCWQLDLDKFVLLNGDWAKHLTTSRSGSVLESVRASLADTCPYIIAQPYKLLVHEKGSFFKAHTDTQRTPGMYGTLLVHLPSAHSGGEFVVSVAQPGSMDMDCCETQTAAPRPGACLPQRNFQAHG
ncbi:hypothetical protein WJX72_001996 [[Myrmecia] bisecta]|uniref:Prolyl 4-hydroxylase alpha subunit Fe(2+) 2OG dioxygenase domain-containing protein n=1 Tax=[Myrmecia] bisecta TaxID=41462 RepID=A0AAW1Q3H8_9CHLO